jgi:hypothetical protein
MGLAKVLKKQGSRDKKGKEVRDSSHLLARKCYAR